MNLADLSPERRAALLAGAKRVQLARGESAYVPGDRAERIYFVRSGRMKIVRTSFSGADSIVAIRSAGDVFGELASADDGPRTTSAIAIEPAEVDALETARFSAALDNDAELARTFARGVAQRLADAEYELAELLGKSVPGRLVDALGRLAQQHGVRDPDGTVRIGINLTHKDLADLIGTSRETLTKELGVLAEIGLVRVAHKTVTLVAPQAFPFVPRAAPPP